jgi:hypothetical protein
MSGPTARAALRSRQETRSADFLALLRRDYRASQARGLMPAE